MVWEVDIEYIDEWLNSIDEDSHDQVVAALDLLRVDGPKLRRPLVDSIKGSRHHNMKELRPGSSGNSELRLLFVFDPERRAIVLVAGDKRGEWTKWYRRNIPIADARYDAHLAKTGRLKHGKDS